MYFVFLTEELTSAISFAIPPHGNIVDGGSCLTSATRLYRHGKIEPGTEIEEDIENHLDFSTRMLQKNRIHRKGWKAIV